MWGSLKLTNADLTSQLQGQGAGALNACTLHVVKGKLSLESGFKTLAFAN